MNSIFYKTIARLGRRLYMIGRQDNLKSQINNGEFFVLRKILLISKNSHDVVVVDIGANKGIWSNYFIALTYELGISFSKLYIIEPAFSAFKILTSVFNVKINTCCVEIINIAFDTIKGKKFLYSYGFASGINSLHKFIDSNEVIAEKVNVETFDNFALQKKLTEVNYVKSDTEGNCLNIMLGASLSLARGIVQAWQFEYNHRWLYADASLFKVFKFIEDKPYFFAKITKNKMIIYTSWHFELERYFEANYILLRKDIIPLVREVVEFHVFNANNVSEKCDYLSAY